MELTTLDIETQGSLGGQLVTMGISSEAVGHLMNVLTNLYSNRPLAVLREYSTNAWDSHKEAGTTRPIEVTLPNALNPYLRIKDFGVGMSVDDVTQIYSQYGASTKRHSNDYNGQLGLGCKSALAYTNQFNIVAIKGGVKTHVSVSLQADGTGSMEIVDTSATDEPNGVEIIIPVRDRNEIIREANHFYRFWEKGSVLVNGQEPNFITGEQIDEGILLVDGLDSDYLVMGNVAYPTDEPIFPTNIYRNHGIVAKVKIGEVNFTPSREALRYTTLTKNKIADIKARFQTVIAARVVADIDAAKDKREAIGRYQVWKQRFGNLNPIPTYKGLEFTSKIQLLPEPTKNGDIVPTAVYWRPEARWDNLGYTRSFSYDLSSSNSVFIVTGWTGDKPSSSQKGRVSKYVTDVLGKYRPNTVYFVPVDEVDDPWVEIIPTASWADIKKATKVAATRKNALGGYEVYRGDGTESTTIDPDEPIIYGSHKEYDKVRHRTVATWFGKDIQVVSITANRYDKFRRDFPGAKSIRAAVQEKYNASFAALTDTDKAILTLDQSEKDFLNALDLNKIDDESLSTFMKEISGGPNARTKAWVDWSNRARSVRCNTDTLNNTSCGIFKRYPLLKTGYYGSVDVAKRHKDHVYVYMNAAYAAFYKDKE